MSRTFGFSIFRKKKTLTHYQRKYGWAYFNDAKNNRDAKAEAEQNLCQIKDRHFVR